ncbi:DUF433 domain-containing protein [Tepidiforma thermophila]|uniref:Uncharacterized protein (DUF433 family) n=1 Tax=Tepidiforma thermophila (strain KCTC 52669 / CGMCC 1.13589 / G233) TaxID=2761530 RepID=A0A2A9HGB7_TEPT2|nr:DUF433 domain-containing protein [Tepidiforma thermophila]PFG73859.1 uncharacterized protein (DUF433 family) [Tepidiforma thermophila]
MSKLDWREYIEVDAAVLGGRPVVRGTRIAVQEVLDAVDRGEEIATILGTFPQLTREAVLAVIQFRLAHQYVQERKHAERRRPPFAPGPG